MRKLTYVTFLLGLFSALTAHAETRLWDISVYGGFTLSQPSFEGGTEKPASASGAAFGLGIKFHFMPKTSLGLDLIYLSKGFRDDQTVPTRYDLYYLEFPVQVFYQLSDFVTIHGGIYLPGLLLSSTRVRAGSSTPDKSDFGNGYGLTGGLRIGFRATPRLYIGVDFRFDYGLANILNDQNPDHIMHNRTFLSLTELMFSL